MSELIFRGLRHAYYWADSLHIFWKSLALLIFKSLLASFVLAIVTPFATAAFATRYGFRVPIEGVPYITTTVATWSFFGFLLSAGVMMVLIGALAQLHIISFLNKVTKGALLKILRKVIRYMTYFFGLLSFLYTVYGFFFPHTVSNNADRLPYSIIILYFITAILVLIAFLIFVKELSILTSQIYISLIVVVVVSFSLFIPDTYGSFLRIIRYGGGVPVSVSLKTGAIERFVSGYLLIQNDAVLIMLSSDGKSIYEVPTSNILYSEIKRNEAWRLPAPSFMDQKRYLHVEIL